MLINRALPAVQTIVQLLDDRRLARLRSYLQRVLAVVCLDRKTAAMVNREFLEWLAGRTQPERPFFAFIELLRCPCPVSNFRRGGCTVSGSRRPNSRQRGLIQHWADLDKSRLAPRDVAFAADAYDDCIADLDEQLGKLLDELGAARCAGANLADHRLGPR